MTSKSHICTDVWAKGDFPLNVNIFSFCCIFWLWISLGTLILWWKNQLKNHTKCLLIGKLLTLEIKIWKTQLTNILENKCLHSIQLYFTQFHSVHFFNYVYHDIWPYLCYVLWGLKNKYSPNTYFWGGANLISGIRHRHSNHLPNIVKSTP